MATMTFHSIRDPDSCYSTLHVALTQLAEPQGWMMILDIVTIHWPELSHMTVPVFLGGWSERTSFQAARCS